MLTFCWFKYNFIWFMPLFKSCRHFAWHSFYIFFVTSLIFWRCFNVSLFSYRTSRLPSPSNNNKSGKSSPFLVQYSRKRWISLNISRIIIFNTFELEFFCTASFLGAATFCHLSDREINKGNFAWFVDSSHNHTDLNLIELSISRIFYR